MPSLNKVILIGHLGKDPEVKYTPSGTCVCKFSLATTESFKKNDQWEDKTEWHNIVLFNKQAEYVQDKIFKGSLVYLEGKITNRSWEDENGNTKYITEILGNTVKNLTKKEN